MTADSEQPVTLTQYWEVALRRRWWILGTLFSVWAAAYLATFLLSPRYRSETTILIDELQVPPRDTQADTGSGLQERLQTLTPQILSRTRLQRIIADLKLYGGQGGNGAPDSLFSQIRRDIKVQPLQVTGRPNELAAFTVSYSASSPALAQQVTRRLTSLFIEENVRTRAQRSEETTSFLETQLQDARAWLQKQEARLQQFKEQYLGQLPSQMQANNSVLGTLDARLQNASQELQRARQQKVYLGSLLGQYRQLRLGASTASSAPAPPALDAELARLRQQTAELRLRYTEEFPDLIRLREELGRAETLKAQITQELAASPGEKPEDSPTTFQIQSQLKANEQEITDRQNEIAGIEREIRAVQIRLRNTPVREQQLAELTRDYDQSRAYYDSLLARRNQSQLAGSLERRQQGEQFRVLDPPSLPAAPYYPSRLKFSLAGLLLGGVAGAVLAYIRELLDDHLHSRSQVESLCPAPILAAIPPANDPRDSIRRRLRIGGEIAGVTALLALVTGTTYLAFIARYRD